jgi:Domain of unknown function (DUF222)
MSTTKPRIPTRWSRTASPPFRCARATPLVWRPSGTFGRCGSVSSAQRAMMSWYGRRPVRIGLVTTGWRCSRGWLRATDTWEAVAAQVAAALRCSVAMGSSYLRYAMAMRDRLRRSGRCSWPATSDYRAFQTIVFRTDLNTAASVLAEVDAQLAVLLARCPAVTRGRLAAAVDHVVAKVDRDAVRRAAKAANDRFVDVITDEAGMGWVDGSMFATDGQALDRRLDELAATVCDASPHLQAASGRCAGRCRAGTWCAGSQAQPIAISDMRRGTALRRLSRQMTVMASMASRRRCGVE